MYAFLVAVKFKAEVGLYCTETGHGMWCSDLERIHEARVEVL